MSDIGDRDRTCVACDEPVGPFNDHHRILGNRADNRLSNRIRLCGTGTSGCHGFRVHGSSHHADPARGRAWAEELGYRVSRHTAANRTQQVPVWYQQHSLGRVGWYLLADDGTLTRANDRPAPEHPAPLSSRAAPFREVIAPGAVHTPATVPVRFGQSGPVVGAAYVTEDDAGVHALMSFGFRPEPRTIHDADLTRGSIGVHGAPMSFGFISHPEDRIPTGEEPSAVSTPTARIELDYPIDLNTPVRVVRIPEDFFGEDDDRDIMRTLTLGELIAEQLIDRAGDSLSVEQVADRLRRYTDEEVRAIARRLIDRALHTGDQTDGSRATPADLTLAARIEAEVWRQARDPSSTTMAHGRTGVPVLEAIIATAVTEQFREMAGPLVAEIKGRILAEIGTHAQGKRG